MTAAALDAAALALLYWLPGAALLEILWPELRADPRHDRLSRLTIAAAASLAIHPLLVLWCWTLGLPAGVALTWGVGLAGGFVVASRFVVRRGQPVPHAREGAGFGWIDGVLSVVLVLLILSRWIAVRDLLVPAWGDSVQHTVLTQLFLENDGLFQSWAPYAPMESLTYHFGFHSVAAAWSRITGATAADAVLWTGQIAGVIAVVALYPLTLQLTGGRRAAATTAVLVAGLLSPMPAFYPSWGRYTQLAGQAVLPVLVVLLDFAWFDRRRPDRRLLALMTALLAGLFLTHYRVSLIAAAAFVVWPAAALWRWRGQGRKWWGRVGRLFVVALSAFILIAPWVAVLGDGLLLSVHGHIAQIDPSVFSASDALRAWHSIPLGASLPVALALGLAVAVGAVLRERAVLLLVGWSAAAALATNPFLLGLPGMGFVTNFAIGIAAYIPVAILIGTAVGRSVPWLEARTGGRAVLAGALVLAAFVGYGARARPVAREFRLVTPADVRAFEWIRENTPRDAHFQVNVGLAYGGKTAVGTDAGWWLPYFTGRSSVLPPLPYASERMNERLRHDVWAIPWFIRRNIAAPKVVRPNYCYQAVTHVYLGDKRGSVGADGAPLLPAHRLEADPKMRLVFETGRAQVWEFDRSECGNWTQNVRRTKAR